MSTSTPPHPPEYFPAPPGVARPWPTTVLWRWRYETALAVAIPLLGWLAIRTFGVGPVVVTVGVIGIPFGAVAPLRQVVNRRVLCVVVQHRVRTGLAQAWVHNRKGRLPALLWTRPTPYGEAVLLWLPAGVCEEHVIAAGDVLRSACWARHVQVSADPRRRHLVTVDVVRRAMAGDAGP